MSVIDRQKPREGSAYANYAYQRSSNRLKRVVFWTVCLLVSVAFWGWLLQPTFAETQDYQTARQKALTGVLENLAGTQKKADKAELLKPTKPKESLTNSDNDKLRQHLAECWVLPKQSMGMDVKVDIEVKLDPDGYIIKADIEKPKQHILKKDPILRDIAEAALAAMIDCQPLPLPKEKYELWKHFIFGFNAKFM